MAATGSYHSFVTNQWYNSQEEMQRAEQERNQQLKEEQSKQDQLRQEQAQAAAKQKAQAAAQAEQQRQEQLATQQRQAEISRQNQINSQNKKLLDEMSKRAEDYQKSILQQGQEALKYNQENAAKQDAANQAAEAARKNATTTTTTPWGTTTIQGDNTTFTESPEAKAIRELLQGKETDVANKMGQSQADYEAELRKQYDTGLSDIEKQYQAKGTSGSSMEAYEKAKYIANRDKEVALTAADLRNKDVSSYTTQLGTLSDILSKGAEQGYGFTTQQQASQFANTQLSSQTELEKLKLATEKDIANQQTQLDYTKLGTASNPWIGSLGIASQFYR